MYSFSNLALVFTLFVNVKSRPLQDSLIQAARHEKSVLYVLLSPEGLSRREGYAIKARKFKRLYKINSFSIQLDSNRTTILEDKAVWGYQYGNGTIYRNYNFDFLKVEESGSLIVYSRSTTGFRGRQHVSYYFSKTLDGPVFPLDLNNVLVQFKDNSCFIEKLGQQLGRPYDCAAWDSKRSSFVVVEIMKQCN